MINNRQAGRKVEKLTAGQHYVCMLCASYFSVTRISHRQSCCTIPNAEVYIKNHYPMPTEHLNMPETVSSLLNHTV